ncbi:complex I NDUFA9 subunit family protein [Pelagibacterium limicola]|uniref:complex I NDUFA9 subunit family protein n=1 Tax=Pelagibacterium limicola TaxID=2791022 RepID=UPI0018AF994A|nr:complex I NDUFA9 subunit family protein [Pelagibacterium limicola]
MSETGKLVTVFGGSGFVGTQVVQELARRGYRVRVAVRRPDLAGHVRMYGFPGQIQPVQANLRYPDSVLAAARGSSVIVNLVGILFEKGGQKFRAVQTQGAKNVAEAAKAVGARRLVHMSAIGADADSPSAYARSKAAGEIEVLKAFPGAVIVRPSIIFGQGDNFFNLFGMLARISPVLPLIHGDTKFQPVYVGDVAQAIANLVDGTGKAGETYEFGGPEIETMRGVLDRVKAETRRNRPLLPLPAGLASVSASVLALLPRPLLTPDQVAQLARDNVVSAEAIRQKRTLSGLGVAPTAMDAVIPTYLWRFRKHGEFDRQIEA